MMNKCVICGNDSGKGRTCSSTCRSRLRRSVALCKEQTVANSEIATLCNSSDATVSARPAMVARIATVRPSDGTDQDNIRAGVERLTAALGPAFESAPKPQSYNSMMVGYVPKE